MIWSSCFDPVPPGCKCDGLGRLCFQRIPIKNAFLYAICQSATTSAGRCFVLSRFVLSRLEKYRRKKNGPETGAISLGGNQRTESKAQPGLRLTVSKSETGEVAIARRDPGAGHQQAVDRGHQAGEKAVGGCEADGSSLGHWSSLFRVRRAPRRDVGNT